MSFTPFGCLVHFMQTKTLKDDDRSAKFAPTGAIGILLGLKNCTLGENVVTNTILQTFGSLSQSTSGALLTRRSGARYVSKLSKS